MSDTDPILCSGKEIGGYRVEHRLGQGGMGAVYAAIEPTIGRHVAIKVLRADLAGDDKHAQRFEREARSMSVLRHPAIIDVFAFGKLEDGRPYFVMPLLQGHTLREHLAREGKLPPKEAWRIAREIAEGLSAAHAAGVLHRDLKPDNVFLAEYAGRPSQPILLDFGLAKRIGAGTDDVDPKDEMKLTATGVPLGTPIYMAPEQWWSSPSSQATDQYALGVVLFELLAGRPPFDSQNFAELLQQHLHKLPPRLSDVGVEVDAAIEALIARLLSKEPSDRYESVADVIATGDASFGGAVVSPAIGAGSASRSRAGPAGETAAAHSATEVALPSAIVSGSGTNRSAKLGFALTTGLGLGALWAVGYAGAIRWSLDQWMMSMGWGGPMMLVGLCAAIVALPALAIRARFRPGYGPIALLVALLPVFLSLPSALGGWGKVTASVDAANPGVAFEILHVGYFEVGLSSFFGLGVSACLCLGLIVLLGAPVLDVRSPWAIAAAVLAAVALASAAFGVPSVVLVLLPAATALLLLSSWTTTPTSLSRERALAALSSVLCARAAAHSRADAVAAVPWFEAPTRADRVLWIVAAATEKRFTVFAEIVSIGLVLAAASLVLWRAHKAGFLAGSAARTRLVLGAVQGGLLLAALVPTLTFERDFESRSNRLAATLSEQFVLYARLDPPTASGASRLAPALAPALQVTQDTIALNGKGVGKLSALDTDTGRQAIANAIVTGLAAGVPASSAEGEADPFIRVVDVALLVDRRVPWSRVEQVLRIAFDGGARSADLLLTQGQEPNIPKHAPPEAGFLLPRDFVALQLALGERGFSAAPHASFAEVAAELLTLPGAGDAPIDIALRAAR